MSNEEDENHIVAEIVHEILSGSDYDPKNVPKRYIPKLQAVLLTDKRDAIARGQLPTVKKIQAALNSLPETNNINSIYTNSLLDRKNKKRTFQPLLNERITPRYMSKGARSNLDTPASRYSRPKTALQKNNKYNVPNTSNKAKKARPNSNLANNSEDNEFSAIDFEPEYDTEKNDRVVHSSPPTAKIQRKAKKRLYTDEQLDIALEHMVNGNTFIPKSDVLPELIDYSKRKIDSLIENGELITAQKYENIYRQMQSSKLAWQECSTKSAKLNELKIYLNKAEKSLQNAEENMQIELNDYDERMIAIREAQEKAFEKELIEFDEETNFKVIERSEDENLQSKSSLSTSRSSAKESENTESSLNSTSQSISSNKSVSNKSKLYPNLPPSFRKFSQRLLDLREREKLLLKTRRFEEAGYARIEADKIEAIEIQQCKLNYLKSREDKRAKLIEEHNQKIKCFEENTVRIRQRLQTENESRISALKRAKENFKSRIGRLDTEIKDTLSITPAPSPLQSGPLSPHGSPVSYSPPTFMTQQQQQQQQQTIQRQTKNQPKSDDSQAEVKSKTTKKKATPVMATPQIVYRPIPSKWRLQTPQILKMHK